MVQRSAPAPKDQKSAPSKDDDWIDPHASKKKKKPQVVKSAADLAADTAERLLLKVESLSDGKQLDLTSEHRSVNSAAVKRAALSALGIRALEQVDITELGTFATDGDEAVAMMFVYPSGSGQNEWYRFDYRGDTVTTYRRSSRNINKSGETAFAAINIKNRFGTLALRLPEDKGNMGQRAKDMEVRFLSAMDQELAGVRNATVDILVYTKLAPCWSCLGVYSQFLKKWRGLHVNVYVDWWG